MAIWGVFRGGAWSLREVYQFDGVLARRVSGEQVLSAIVGRREGMDCSLNGVATEGPMSSSRMMGSDEMKRSYGAGVVASDRGYRAACRPRFGSPRQANGVRELALPMMAMCGSGRTESEWGAA